MGKTIIFDVDGTLLDTERIYMRAWQEAAAGFGFDLPWEALQQTRAISTAQAEAVYRQYCGEQFQLKPIYPERVRIAEEIIEKSDADSLLMPYARQTLVWLREQGYTIAVASSTGVEKTRSHLAHAGLMDSIDIVVGGDMVEHGKPAPDIFLLAAQQSGAQPEECLVVGDSPADVGAAKGAGIPMVLIPDQVPLNAYMKENSRWVLDSLQQLPGVVEEHSGKGTRVVFCSDVHLCHMGWCGRSSDARMERMVEQLNSFYEEKPYEKLVFFGDYSLDHWKWQIKGCWIERGVSEAQRFAKEYAARLKAPYYLLPGNHEQYGEVLWQQLVGFPRSAYFAVGGYLIICCDNFAGELDPTEHSDGVYSVTDLDFVRKAMAEHPDLPVILCAHNFDLDKEPEAFFEFLKEEKRITLLICGHDHIVECIDLGERADHVCLYHDGHFSYPGKKQSPVDNMWGFCEAILTDKGVDMRYIEPENEITLEHKPHRHLYREREHRFFPRRDV